MTLSSTSRVPLSVLDLAPVGTGQTSSDALAASTLLAQAADDAGYARFWVAEHHNMAAVASTTPPVLIAHLAARTERISVGSGGVMLPNHAPLVVAEQFAMLEALHPGRIDLGIGRAPGTDPRTAAALRRSTDTLGVEEFPQHLLELRDELSPTPQGTFRGTPHATSAPRMWLLGSSPYSAQVAAALSLPYVYAHHFNTGITVDAVQAYRAAFRPSEAMPAPHVMVSASAIVAETREEAEFLAGPSRVMALALRTGRGFGPIVTPEAAASRGFTAEEKLLLEHLPGTQVVGTADDAVAYLDRLVDETGADEVMVTGTAHAVETRIDTLRRLAAAW
ncbi:luciferase family oxidoreductase group 1 [Sediminihabitans luteus]|uniref:Luciferase family oxidoreductase group 1 n=1 Tax=Sediminihabitans luteus TaxID=1138585 RepID=A0A2M9CD66_9CELL|nr:LLM class flavin-dependent oxidoreductase [Sediminihabitans luteus]PJJ69241.1 luciferase family oxidoreductase group 1 [Sediminihabitans luteus]GII98917.1 alkanal monooxygenase subunit alpha [Sediminihabitans luteus]